MQIESVLEVIPLKSVGKLQFGMSPEQVKSQVYDSLQVTATGVWFVERPVLRLDFDSSGLSAVGSAVDTDLSLRGVRLTGKSYSKGLALLKALDPNVIEQEDGFYSESLGFSAYAPQGKNAPRAKIEGVMAFKKDYYK